MAAAEGDRETETDREKQEIAVKDDVRRHTFFWISVCTLSRGAI